MKTLIILAHPNIAASKVNRLWKKALEEYPDQITIHELYIQYKNWEIDVPKEQALLESYEHIILQFPLYWYSYPPLLKKWLDDVLTHGWAYGSQGHKLKNKKFSLALSIGDKKENYQSSGPISFTVDELIAPFKASLTHVGAQYLPYFAIFGISYQATEFDIQQSAKDYIDYIFSHNK